MDPDLIEAESPVVMTLAGDSMIVQLLAAESPLTTQLVGDSPVEIEEIT